MKKNLFLFVLAFCLASCNSDEPEMGGDYISDVLEQKTVTLQAGKMDSVTINLKTDRWNLTSIDLVSGENVQTKRVESYEQSFPNGTHFPTPCDTLTHDWIKAVKTAPTELMVVTQENTASTPRTAYVRIEGTVGLNVSEMLTVTQNGAK